MMSPPPGGLASPGYASRESCSRCAPAAGCPVPPSLPPSLRSLRSAPCPATAASTACSRIGCAATAFTTILRLLNVAAGDLQRRRDVDQREVPHLAVADLLEVELRAGPGGRNANRGQQVARLHHRHAGDVDRRPDEELFRRHDALAARCCESPSARRAPQAPAPCRTGSPRRSGSRRTARARG